MLLVKSLLIGDTSSNSCEALVVIPSILKKVAQTYGSSVAYVTADGEAITYKQLDHYSEEVAAWMRFEGVQEGSVVALCLPSRIEYILSYLAVAKLGAVTAGINPRFTGDERKNILKLLRPDLVVTAHDCDQGIQDEWHVEYVHFAEQMTDLMIENRRNDPAIEVLPPDPDRPVCICFTSGSTGDPKGAWFKNRQLQAISNLDTGGAWGGSGHRYASTEFAHVGVMTKLPWLLASGGTTHLLDKWRAESILRLIHDYRISAVSAIAPQVALMLRVENLSRFDFSCVQAIVTGGASASPDLVAAGREIFGAPWSIRYSSTESGGVGLGTALDADKEEALHTVGRPRQGVKASIRNNEGQLVPDGEIGEIWMRSNAVMSGYWNDENSTDEVIVNGWLRTGDLAIVDDSGCFRLAGRIKEMFIRGGYNVFPLEVETVISKHKQVSEVVVVPREDEVMGEIGVAVVVPSDPKSPPTLESIQSHAKNSLASYKVPEAIRIVSMLPRNSSDKIDRREIQKREER